ncbi:hypothetical protein H072_1679 [Dactylellina haptotyla CBS 200.50]|uniref:Zn(2)-C6 fungal-type domain-containing protein n=1 Tax=Dactylellina haptotyla (strain CBS 200.50) TaxID=1284197 RepID=S8BY01_DACHA|nr:hypothetical protein H072_1679 [Dactylellina haptotyla CBS 200.50]
MFTIQKNRRACDRCHFQKLLCKRDGTDGPCVRCAKGKLACHITPRLKKKRKTSASSREKAGSLAESLVKSTIEPIEIDSLEAKGELDIFLVSSTEDSNSGIRIQEDIDFEGTPGSATDIELPHPGFSTKRGSSVSDDGTVFEALRAEFEKALESPDFSTNGLFRSGEVQTDQKYTIFSTDPALLTPLSWGAPADDFQFDISSAFPSPQYSPREVFDLEFGRSTLHGYSMDETRDSNTFFEIGECSSPGLAEESLHNKPTLWEEKKPSPSREWISTVMELNSHMSEHYEANRNADMIHQSDPQNPTQIAWGRLSCLDETFMLSEKLLEIYNQIQPEFSQIKQHGVCKVSHEWDFFPEIPDFSGSEPTNKTPLPLLRDPASELLLLSCRIRLLEIYLDLLRFLEDAVQQMSLNPSNSPPAIPSFKIGVFPLKSASLNLQLAVILQIMGHYIARLQKEASIVKQPMGDVRSSKAAPMMDIADATLSSIKKHEIEALEIIRRIKV